MQWSPGNDKKCETETMRVEDAIVKGISITLTSEENELFATLREVGRAYEKGIIDYASVPDVGGSGKCMEGKVRKGASGSEERQVEIRVAGGWVRDKLLGLLSDDVDIAVDIMSGHEFAVLVQRYLALQGVQPAKISVIAANPSQSKHLETATMKIHGLECDMVHLRGGEVYSDTSRIPTLKTDVTPLDDALRRDFTINALFYSVTHARLEDWTGRGIRHLLATPKESRRLTTPLHALTTFKDDPLRILRAVRFAVRFDIQLHHDIHHAAATQEVTDSLMRKVSRERVGKELDGMLQGKAARPAAALCLLVHLGLADSVFSFHAALPVTGHLEGSTYANARLPLQHRIIGWHEARLMVQCSLQMLPTFETSFAQLLPPTSTSPQPTSSKKQKKSNQSQPSSLDQRMMYIATFLYPFRNLSHNVKGKTSSITSYIVRESLKFKNNDVHDVNTIMNNVDALRDVLSKSYIQSTTPRTSLTSSSVPFCRMEVGLILRNLKELWVTALLIAAVAETRSIQKEIAAVETQQQPQSQETISTLLTVQNEQDHSMTSCLEGALQFYHDIHSQSLDGCWKLRPLLDGRALIQSLDLPRGPIVGKYMQEQVRWMLLHPSSTSNTVESSKYDCESYLKGLRQRELVEENERTISA